jgi:hypothetical protein
VWAVLLHVILLVTSTKSPEQLSTQSSTGKWRATTSTGIVTVNANLVGELLADKALSDVKWGATVSFASTCTLWLHTTACLVKFASVVCNRTSPPAVTAACTMQMTVLNCQQHSYYIGSTSEFAHDSSFVCVSVRTFLGCLHCADTKSSFMS